MQDRDGVAYSLFIVKSVNDERRMISGIATTPAPDDVGDVIEPLGLKFRNPLPLLMHHDRKLPVGNAVFGRPTQDGVPFDATFPVINDPGTVKTRVDEAWHSVKAGLIRGVSVGIKILTKDVERIKDGGLRILRSEVFELSLVTIPANAEATITSIKQFDQAATGLHSPGDSGSLPVVRALKDAPAMNTIAEQITSFEKTRADKNALMVKMMTENEGQTLDAAQTEAYDTLAREVQSIDAHLPRLKALQANQTAAVPITGATTAEKASELRGGNPVITVKANVPAGTAFTRYVMAKIAGRGSDSDAIMFAERQKHWQDQTPEVMLSLKAAVNPGTIAEPAWAAPLAVQRPMQEEFLDLLRPETILGKVPGFKRVPFNVSVPVQTGGGTYTWVGEGAAKPVGNLQFSSVTLGIAKAAGIIVISEELAKISSPSAEATVRNDMIRGMAQYLDQQFIDPTVAAVTNVSPASITNLSNGFATAGTSADNARTDLKKAITLFTASLLPVSESVWIMSEANAFALSTYLTTTNASPIYPGVTAKGGMIFGIPVVTSQTAGSVVALVHAPSILFADDGGVNIDVSREASLEMNTTPTSPSTASVDRINLWQSNLIGLRAERFINWKRARTTAVVYTTATYL